MKQEITVTGKTIEEALKKAAEQLGVDADGVSYEVIDLPKKGFLGFGEVPAKIKVTLNGSDAESAAVGFIETVIKDMNLNASVELSGEERSNGDKIINIVGEDAGVLIGYHGDTLDALQYLVNLVANKNDEDDERTRFSVDIENYRAKREDTLRRLAQRMASKVLKYKKNITLEPMNSYERRIIHSEIQNIEGVTTMSVGTENNRRIVIYVEGKEPGGSGDGKRRRRRPRAAKETTQE